MSVSAIVRMTVQVNVGSSWGDKCSFDQIERQASEEAVKDLYNAASKTRGDIAIIGKPTVMAVQYTKAQQQEWSDRERLRSRHPAMKAEVPKPGWKITPLFAWYDLWIGAYWDRKAKRLYVLPLPCLGFVIDFDPKEGN